MIFQTEENSQSFKKDDLLSPSEGNAPQSLHGRQGCWSQDQIFKFVSYLIYNRQSLKLKLQRRTSKIFKQMAQFIGTRNAIQCRSQNQRLFRKHRNFRSIVASFKSQYGKEQFQKEYQSLIVNPQIKFKTDLEYYFDQQIKNSREIGCQTEPEISENQFYSFSQVQFANNLMKNTYPFWMVLSYHI